jgi:hypothetical protein
MEGVNAMPLKSCQSVMHTFTLWRCCLKNFLYVYTDITCHMLSFNRWSVHLQSMVNRFLVNKTNRRTEFRFYWYYDSACFRQPFCPSSGVLSRTSALVHFMLSWWPLLPACWPFASTSCVCVCVCVQKIFKHFTVLSKPFVLGRTWEHISYTDRYLLL